MSFNSELKHGKTRRKNRNYNKEKVVIQRNYSPFYKRRKK